MSAEKPTFREVVAAALEEAGEQEGAVAGSLRLYWIDGADLAKALQAELKRAGYSIHRSGECVHPRTRASELGRPMTEEEQERLLGGLLSGDPAT